MAYLRKNKKKSGLVAYYSLIKSVKWSSPKYISLKTSSKVTARVRHSEVQKNETDIKNGMDISFSWDNDEGRTLVKQLSYKDAIDRWLLIKQTNVKSETYRRYVCSMNCFMNVVGDTTPLSSITNQNIEDFKLCYTKYHTPVGININLRGIKAFLRWAYDDGLMDKMPKIQMMKEFKIKPKYITEQNWRALMELDSLDGFWKDVFRMYLTTGMRRSEPLNGSIDGSFLIVPAHLTKGNREYEIPLNDFQVSVIQELQKALDTFIAKGSSLKTFKSKVSKKFTDACKKIDIYVPKKTTLHCLRHTFAVKKYLQTRDLYEVCKRLNHDKFSTTEIYAQFSYKRLEQDFPTLAPKQAKKGKVTPNKVTPNTDKLNNPHREMPIKVADC